MATAHSFSELAATLNAPRASGNPRIAAGKSVAAWERERRKRRLAEWQSKVAARDATVPVRDAVLPQREFVNFLRADSVLDRAVPIEVGFLHQRPERGPSIAAYYTAKWRRYGTLGEHEGLNPYLATLRKNGGPQ